MTDGDERLSSGVVTADEPALPAPAPPPAPPRPWITIALIAANLIVFALEIAKGADPVSPTAQSMIDLGGNFPPLTLGGEWWRIGSAMFLHIGLLHIGLNMLCLWQGRVVEALFGRAGFAAIYLTAGLIGGIATAGRGALIVSAGASGAIFGVYGAFGAFLWMRRATIPPEVLHKTSRQIGTFVGINLVYGLSQPHIDMTAHIGGIIGGFLAGAALLAGRDPGAHRAARALGVAIAGVAVTIAGLLAVPKPHTVTPVLEEYDRVVAQSASRFDELAKTAGDAADPALADRIEREVLVPWREMRAHVEAETGVPEKLEPMVRRMRALLGSAQRAWETYEEAMRVTGDARQARLQQFQSEEAEAEKDAKAVADEIGRLKQP